MNVYGLESNLYLINNPIWVEITNINPDALYLILRLSSGNLTELRLYPLNGRVIFDISKAVKGNFDEPNHTMISSSLNNQDLENNYKEFNLIFQEQLSNQLGSTFVLTKTFIRGGKKVQGSNMRLHEGDVLKESDKIPVWGGFPAAKYFIQNSKIYYTRNIPQNEIENIRVPASCEPLYVRFLNSKGGYSNWLFEKWTENEKTTSLDYVEERRTFVNGNGGQGITTENRHLYNHLGSSSEFEITAETRVKEEYYDTISALIQSPEVYIYNQYGLTWARVINNNNNFSRKNVERMQKISLKFDVPTTKDTRVIW